MGKIREEILISELAGDDFGGIPEDWRSCEIVQRSVFDYDLEKSRIDWEVVVKRLSDGKFFKFFYKEYCAFNEIRRSTESATEVFGVGQTFEKYE